MCTTEATTGELVRGHRQYDYRYGVSYTTLHEKCADCGTQYIVIDGDVRCNGHTIIKCPWCRPDSRPWFAGRGC